MELVRDRAKIQTQEICALNIVVILSMPLNQYILEWGNQKTKKNYNSDWRLLLQDLYPKILEAQRNTGDTEVAS